MPARVPSLLDSARARAALPASRATRRDATTPPLLPARSLQPVGARFASGIFFLQDTRVGEPDAGVAALRPPDAGAAGGEDGAPEAAAPEPFEWVVGQYY